MENKRSPIEVLIGLTMTINPQRLLNKRLLFSKQNYIDIDRTIRAVKSLSEPQIAKAGINMENIHGKKSLVLTITDGNHRVGLACLRNEKIDVYIEGIWIGKNRWGFNKIKQQLGILLKDNVNYI